MKAEQPASARRIVLIHWKKRKDNPFEVFSNLKNFCASYPQYSYNTLNNYLSKEKKPFENADVRVERQAVISKVIPVQERPSRFRIAPVVRKARLSDIDETAEDLAYWQSKSPAERIAALTFIISQFIQPGTRMDRSAVVRRKMHT